jgi:uncharacterized membrane protein
MSANPPQGLNLLAKTVIVLAIVMVMVGIVWHGIHPGTFDRIWHDLVARPDGQMSFRFFLQPTMAAIAAYHDGVKDARMGRSPFFRAVVHEPETRAARLKEALNDTARIILLGIGMDVIYQYKAFGTFYPAEALDIALLLAFVPYLLLRGPIERIASRLLSKKQGD